MNLDRRSFATSLTGVVRSLVAGKKLVAGTVLVAAAAVLSIAGGAFRASVAIAQPDARPNIIVILVDDMGWSDIGPYGGEIPTPNLDALPRPAAGLPRFSTPHAA